MLKGIKLYFQDRFIFIISYIFSFALITLYYYISSNMFEALYPLTIVAVILATALIIDGYRYITFYTNIKKSVDNVQYDLAPVLEEHKMVSGIITSIHNHYMKEMYEVTNKQTEKDHFVTHWVHSIKTPVSVINVILQELADHNVEVKKAIKEMKSENERTNHILEQVLSLARLDDFSKDYLPEPVNLVELLKKQINLQKRKFIYQGIYPKLNKPNEEVIVLTDEKWCAVLLDQFISNAIKYSPKNQGKKINFSIELIEESGRVILMIEDEGIGIPSYDLPRIFEPFFTGQNGRSEKNATGIGLYMCWTIAAKLGHELHIESEEGKGTKVYITYITKM